MKDFLKQFFDIKFWKFILVGILNTIVGNGLMFLFYNFTPIKDLDQVISSGGYWTSSALGYIIGSIVSYILNKHFTFKAKKKSAAEVVRFVINILVCYGLAYGIAQPAMGILLADIELSVSIFEQISMLFGMGIFVVLNYFGQKFFVFKKS